MFKIYPYNMASQSARVLARELLARRVWPNRNYRPREGHTVINWGNINFPYWWAPAMVNNIPVLNSPGAIESASNKLLFLQRMSNFGYNDIIPEWTTDHDIAQSWVNVGYPVLARHLLRASQGRGVQLHENANFIERQAPLYVKYVKKYDEFRIHATPEGVFHVQQKRARQEIPREHRNYRVRNYNQGWVFCVHNVECPECVKDAAIRSVQALGLHFGAVDVVYNRHQDSPKVLEINTAPSLNGESTLGAYVNMFRSNYDSISTS